MNDRTQSLPRFLYGTAWKEDRTQALVEFALAAGFRAIDTANQRRHYHEAGVGAALRNAFAQGVVTRDELFLQTKFTYVDSQDARLPYDPAADHPTQVRQSFSSSLEHLGVDRLDSYLLHGPRARSGLAQADIAVWRTMEELHASGRVNAIGISNVTAAQLDQLCRIAVVKPRFVQNRCYARMGWDRDVRRVCEREGIAYQGFSLLTANERELRSAVLREIASRRAMTLAQVVFRFAMHVGMICLTGTTDAEHMREDLACVDFALTDDEVAAIERVAG